MRKIFNPYIIAFIAGIIALSCLRLYSNASQALPEPLVNVPPWQLISNNNEPFGSQDLKGQVFVAYFFFTQCPSICPGLTMKMKELHEKLNGYYDKIKFIGLSVDPQNDTPQVLQAYMQKHQIPVKSFVYLSGTQEAMVDVVVNKMNLHVGDKKIAQQNPNLYDISHLAQFALFDKEGRLRGLFETTPPGLASLKKAAILLTQQ